MLSRFPRTVAWIHTSSSWYRMFYLLTHHLVYISTLWVLWIIVLYQQSYKYLCGSILISLGMYLRKTARSWNHSLFLRNSQTVSQWSHHHISLPEMCTGSNFSTTLSTSVIVFNYHDYVNDDNYLCGSFFIAMLKQHDQGSLQKEGFVWFQRNKTTHCHGKHPTWWQEELKVHILTLRRETTPNIMSLLKLKVPSDARTLV